MELKPVILEQLDREAELTRRALERVPEGKNDWKPHPKSMALGNLAHLVAMMPSWISMILNQKELDIKPKGKTGNGGPRTFESTGELLIAHEQAVTQARDALKATSDEDLRAKWRLRSAASCCRCRGRIRSGTATRRL